MVDLPTEIRNTLLGPCCGWSRPGGGVSGDRSRWCGSVVILSQDLCACDRTPHYNLPR